MSCPTSPIAMTVASTAGIIAGLLMQWGRFGLFFGGRGRNNGGALFMVGALLVSLVVYAISFLLTRLLSRYRELCADRSGAYLTQHPQALASALQKITGQMQVT